MVNKSLAVPVSVQREVGHDPEPRGCRLDFFGRAFFVPETDDWPPSCIDSGDFLTAFVGNLVDPLDERLLL